MVDGAGTIIMAEPLWRRRALLLDTQVNYFNHCIGDPIKMRGGAFLLVFSFALPTSAATCFHKVAFTASNVAGRRPIIFHEAPANQRQRTCGSRICRPMTAVTEMPSIASVSLSSLVQTSPEPIHTAFSIATFAPQPFWLLIILLPENKLTKQIMGGLGES